jgi:choice-of-anchor A domain-containing protein
VTQVCNISTAIDLPTLQLSAFNGIFLNDFTSSLTAFLFGSAGSYGPIAVGNNLYAPGYLIAEKTNLTACTASASGFAQYGLAVGGSILANGRPTVTGNVYVNLTGTAALTLSSCSNKKLNDSQQFDFAAAKMSYLKTSEYFAKLLPNLRMNSTFALSSVGTQANALYNVITLNTCDGPILGCFGASFTGNLTSLLSSTGIITNLSGYQGPTAGTKWPTGSTLVINVMDFFCLLHFQIMLILIVWRLGTCDGRNYLNS